VNSSYHAKTLKGFEQILAGELRDIGAEEVRPVNRGVDFTGSVSMMYKANYCARTALRVLKPIARFKAFNEEKLYRKIREIDWSEYMTYKQSFAVDAVTFSNVFRNNHFVELKIKDAIADQFREKTSLRPSVDLRNADIRINVHVQETYVTVSLDSSGESLHRRGYKKFAHPASLSEVLAAGMVMITGYNGERPFLNPMCGSGTIAIEAAMIASGTFPGAMGRSYSFQHWPDYDEVLFERLKESLPPPRQPGYPIHASDSDPSAVRMTKNNARVAGLDALIDVRKEDFLAPGELHEPSLVIMNPPYGERLKVDDIEALYSGIGNTLKHRFPGSEAWLYSASLDALRFIGLKPTRKIPLFNAGLEGKLLEYQLFSGTRKDFITS
jgi:putative N6-adenine-specific DNA methylase